MLYVQQCDLVYTTVIRCGMLVYTRNIVYELFFRSRFAAASYVRACSLSLFYDRPDGCENVAQDIMSTTSTQQ